MNEVKFLYLIISAVLLIVSSIGLVEAAQISIDKDSLMFSNVRREGYASSTLELSTDSLTDLQLTYSVTGDLKDYITLNSESGFIFNSAAPLRLLLELKPSNSVSNGLHMGSLIINFKELNGPEISTSSLDSIVIPYNIQITDKIIKRSLVNELIIDDVNINKPVSVLLDITNLGNININPRIILKFHNPNIDRSYSLQTSEIVKPYESKKIEFSQGINELNIGNYDLAAYVFIEDNQIYQQSQSFYVLNENEPINKIELLSLYNEEKININNNLLINADLINNGPDTFVKLKGSIYQDDNLITEFETASQLVKNAQKSQLVYNFKPLKEGIYNIRAYLEYGSRKSSVIESAFEAFPETQSLKEVPLSSNPLMAILLMVATVYTMVRISQYRKKSVKRRGE